MRVARPAQAEQVLQLVEHEQSARAQREADDHRVGDVAGEIAEPQQRDAELDHSHHEGQQHGGLDLLVLAFDQGERGEQRDRDRVGGAVDELSRRRRDGPDGRHHDRGVEAVLRGEPGHHRVRHRLGHGDRRHGDPRQRVGARVEGAIAAQGVDGREEAGTPARGSDAAWRGCSRVCSDPRTTSYDSAAAPAIASAGSRLCCGIGSFAIRGDGAPLRAAVS